MNIPKMIEEYGFAVIAVAYPTASFAYTVGLTDVLGYELVSIGSIPPEYHHSIMTTLIDDLKKNNEIDGIIFPAKLADGTLLRGVLKDVTQTEHIMEVVTKRIGEVTKVLQIVYADSKNILPGEPGYDQGFDQWL